MLQASNKLLAPLALVAIFALCSAAGAVTLEATGTNTVVGTAVAEGDIFAEQPAANTLYSGVWAHAYVPAGASGTNSAASERTVPARQEQRDITGANNNYRLTNNYGDTTVVARASKEGSLGVAEAFAEVSSLSSATDGAAATSGAVGGYSQLAAFVTHSGTGTVEAAATGSADFTASMRTTGSVQATGAVSGSVALNGENNYGGSITGAAFKVANSQADSITANGEFTTSEAFEYLYLTSGRNANNGESHIEGNIQGDASASGFFALTGANHFGNSAVDVVGDLSATATTYKLGDNIGGGAITNAPIGVGINGIVAGNPIVITKLDTAAQKSIVGNLYQQANFVGGVTPTASAYQIAQSDATWSAVAATHESEADTESFTAATVTRTLVDTNEAYGAAYIDNGALESTANTASVPGGSPITLASANVDGIFQGSGAHLVSRLTGANPASTADLTVHAEMDATGTAAGSDVTITGVAHKPAGADPGRPNTVVRAVGPAFSSTGTTADATGSYLTTAAVDGTAVHIADAISGFNAASQLIAADTSEINVWSWISGNDPRTHAESKYGLTPFVATPVYTSDPTGIIGVTNGPTVIAGADAVSRNVDTVFSAVI